MTGAIAVALVASGLFVVLGPCLGRRLPPAVAVRLLVPASLVVAGSGVFVLAVMAFTWIGQLPEVAEIGPWSSTTLHASNPIPAAAAALSGVLLLPAAAWAVTLVVRRARAIVAVRRTCRRLGAPGSVVVVDDDRPDAFTTPEITGRIVVTTGLLKRLSPDERRALLAHERSHLTHRHTWWILAADLAAAVNPLLRPTAHVVRHATERWADEDAATAVTDRVLVARTVARAALLQHRTRPPEVPVAAATGGAIPQRVAALLAPRPRPRPVTLAILGILAATVGLATVAVQHKGEAMFENASTSPGSHQHAGASGSHHHVRR
jgi:hypothetical protein